jgi:outer membrane immunogenic protein
MKNILVSTSAAVALLATSFVAQAADLPQRTYAPAPVMVAMYDWSGFYIGGNGGYGTSRNCWGFVPVAGAVIPDGCHNQSGASLVARQVTVGRAVRLCLAWKLRATGRRSAVHT